MRPTHALQNRNGKYTCAAVLRFLNTTMTSGHKAVALFQNYVEWLHGRPTLCVRNGE